jgi:Flp pilus assembly protein protease CpaA
MLHQVLLYAVCVMLLCCQEIRQLTVPNAVEIYKCTLLCLVSIYRCVTVQTIYVNRISLELQLCRHFELSSDSIEFPVLQNY